MRKIVKDMNEVLDDKITSKELDDLTVCLREYAKRRGIKQVDSQKHVDLVLLIAAILNIPEEGFEELLNRLNIIRLHKHGVLDVKTKFH